jgi:hypothetical protein
VPKNPDLGKFWRALEWTKYGIFYYHKVYVTAIWCILKPFDIIFGHLIYVVVILYIFPVFGMLYQEKSGSPDAEKRFLLLLTNYTRVDLLKIACVVKCRQKI